jgi:hypothetical protein
MVIGDMACIKGMVTIREAPQPLRGKRKNRF